MYIIYHMYIYICPVFHTLVPSSNKTHEVLMLLLLPASISSLRLPAGPTWLQMVPKGPRLVPARWILMVPDCSRW